MCHHALCSAASSEREARRSEINFHALLCHAAITWRNCFQKFFTAAVFPRSFVMASASSAPHKMPRSKRAAQLRVDEDPDDNSDDRTQSESARAAHKARMPVAGIVALSIFALVAFAFILWLFFKSGLHITPPWDSEKK